MPPLVERKDKFYVIQFTDFDDKETLYPKEFRTKEQVLRFVNNIIRGSSKDFQEGEEVSKWIEVVEVQGSKNKIVNSWEAELKYRQEF